jgi:hypothetical protein
MVQTNLMQSLLQGKTPKRARMLIASGMAPLPAGETLELLVALLGDSDLEVKNQAAQTLESWDEKEILSQLRNPECAPSLLEFFGLNRDQEAMRRAVIANPSTPDAVIDSLALTVSGPMLEAILDNRVRVIRCPNILRKIRENPSATPAILRVVQEIEFEFLGTKKSEYAVDVPAVEEPPAAETLEEAFPELEFEAPPGDLSLEGLPMDGEAREAEILKQLSSMPVREKIRYALFGNREIRTMLIRDTNKEIARAVLRSPKLTENEVESIAAMRSVAEDILREIGNSKAWTKSYAVVQNLVRNPKSPPAISQRLLFRLRAPDLMMLTRDRSVPDAVRYNASRTLRQRAATRSTP